MLRRNLWFSVMAGYSPKAFFRSNPVVEHLNCVVDNNTDRLLRWHTKLEWLAMTISSSGMTA